MAETTLVGFPLEAGRLLLKEADGEGLETTAAFWLFLPEEETWRLVLAMPATQKEGTISVARRLRTLIDRLPEESRAGLSLSDIAIVSPHLLLIDQMLQRYGTVAENNGNNFRRGGFSRDEPFIYRLTPPNR